MECFAIDESGYTGFDLLNAEQRFQGATAVAISNTEAAYLIQKHFPRLQAPELKYRTLSRKPANHPRLVSFLRELLQSYKSVTYVCDKRFLLMLMFVDYAIEPFYYERDVDLYRDGQNYALGSLLTMTGPTLLGKEPFDALLVAFQRAVKEKDPASLAALVAAARETNWRELPEALGPLAQYAAPECLEAIATPGVSTDAAFVVLQSLITRMEVMSDGPYRVEHDRSKNLETYHDLLCRYIDHEGVVELRQSEIASFNFPLKLTDVAQVDSKASPAVQVADVMIGAALDAANMMTGRRTGGLDPDEIMPLYAPEQFIHLVPDIDFERQREFRAGTQASEMIDYFAKHFAR